MSKNYVSPWSIAGVKNSPSVIPVIGCIALGVAMAAAYTLRLALFSPDVTWTPSKGSTPQNYYENRNYKLIQSEPFDVKNYQHPRPRF